MNAEKCPTSIDEINTTAEKRLDQQYESFERLVKNEKEYMFLISRRYIKMLRRALAFSRIIDGTVFDEHNIMKTKKGYLDGMLYNFDIPLKFIKYLQNIIFIGIEPQKDRLEYFYKIGYNDSTQTEDLIQLDSGDPTDNNVHESGNQTRRKMRNEEPIDDTVNESVNLIQPERRNKELGFDAQATAVLNDPNAKGFDDEATGEFNIENDNTELFNDQASGGLKHPTISKLKKKIDISKLKYTAALSLKKLHEKGELSEESIAEKLEKLEKAVNSGLKKSKKTAALGPPSIDDLGLKDLDILKKKRTQKHYLKRYRSTEDLETYAKQGAIYDQEQYQSQYHQENEPLLGAMGFSGLKPRQDQQIESDLAQLPFGNVLDQTSY
ncbi:hypothetical protein AVEN_158034-1 [Araneus ventricosus]|uniref:Uncharacterized protein n=1 Tax=Araneus ventricosus TaxID=182803 RepID=A0A4Y2RN32_ARAVE|nr:hypothetical protein AVEN_158034-1 [Araneus ventricosus]